MELIFYYHNDRYIFHYIKLTLQRHIRYKLIIIPNPGDILTKKAMKVPFGLRTHGSNARNPLKLGLGLTGLDLRLAGLD